MNESNVVLVKHGLKWGLDEVKVVKLAEDCLDQKKFCDGVELSLLFVGVKRAGDLNIGFRKMDYVPQVLAFPNSKLADADGLRRLGDVVICTKKLKREVKLKQNKGKGVYDVLKEWIDHGVDNLIR